MTDFLHYWQPRRASLAFDEHAGPVRSLDNGHFKRLSQGDTIWIVSVVGDTPVLVVRGQVEARPRRTQNPPLYAVGNSSLWDSYRARFSKTAASPPSAVPIPMRTMRSLRFMGKSDRVSGTLNDMLMGDLSSLRELSASSVKHLTALWRRHRSHPWRSGNQRGHDRATQVRSNVTLEDITATDYMNAITSLGQNGLTGNDRRMLRFHYRSAAWETTARRMSSACGWKNPTTANIHYGKLGRLIGSALGLRGAGEAVSVLVTFDEPAAHSDWEAIWALRPELARALERLGVVSPGHRLQTRPRRLGSRRDPIEVGFEGAMKSRWVAHRKRERGLREQKITDVLHDTGRLRCEVTACGFDFAQTYGDLGLRYAEVHHVLPLSARGGKNAKTRLKNLAVVCANCHAMIHRGGKSRPLAQIAERIKRQRSKQTRKSGSY